MEKNGGYSSWNESYQQLIDETVIEIVDIAKEKCADIQPKDIYDTINLFATKIHQKTCYRMIDAD